MSQLGVYRRCARASRGLAPRAVVFAAAIAYATAGVAGIYDVDDTGTAKRLELKAKFYSTHDRDQQAWRLPGLGVSGRLADNMEWGVSGGYSRVRANGQPAAYGWRDLSAGIKWRFFDPGAGTGVTMAIEPELSLPTGATAAGISKGVAAFELPLRISKPFGRLRLTGQISVARSFGRDDDAAGIGALVEYAASPRWSFGFELVADAPCRQLRRYSLHGDAGFKWKPGSHFQFAMLGGHSLNTAAGKPFSVFRVEFEYRP